MEEQSGRAERRRQGSGRGRRSGRRQAGGGGRRWTTLGALAFAAVTVVLGAAVAHYQDQHGSAAADASAPPGDVPEGNTEEPRVERASGSPEPSPSASSSAPSSSPSGSASTPSGDIDIPATGPGTFTTARADGNVVGTGSRTRRYKVLVEDGVEVSASEAAAEVSAVLADRRGWTRDGVNSFRLVSSGAYDFVVKIATPGTTDRICGAAGLLTRGEVNCSVGTDVVVNLKRWVLGSPQFDGPIGEYRALIVNHEVGHRVGHGHETCPGPGRPAPAMMQQIKGLKGCVANAWPYGRDGTYLGGPAVP